MRIIKSILVSALLLCGCVQILAQCKDRNCGLIIRGRVTDLKIEKEKESVYFDIKLALEFKNEGKEPIILFKPEFKGRYWSGGIYLKATERGESICSFEAWQSLAGSRSKYRKLGEKLDVANPPSKYTKILMPNETWDLEDETGIGVILERPPKIDGFEIDDGFGRCKSWKEIQSFPAKMWLETSYQLNPWNVGYYKPNLIEKLKERWKTFGNVLAENDEDDIFESFRITSEPIPIDFSEVRKKLLK